MRFLELKIPPVALFLVALVLINRLSDLLPFTEVNLPYKYLVFALCFVTAGVIGIAGVVQFRRAKTTVNPVQPHKATTVVDSGVFHYSRNPMYLGLLLLLVGFAYWHQNIISFAVVAGFVVYMNRFQIVPEERALEHLFGEDYVDYKTRVRRWL